MATVEEALQQAAASRDAGRPDVAESVYRAILAKFPQQTQALQGLNDVLQAQGRPTEQSRVLQQSELQDLVALYEAGKLSEAEQTAMALIARFPHSGVLQNVLGAVRLDLGDAGGAVECFRKTLDLEPNAAESHNNLGIALHRFGTFDAAAEQFQAALALNPEFLDALKNLGALYSDMGRVDDAIEALRRGDPDNQDADTSALLLESYLRKGDRTAFDIQLQLIKTRQDAINIRASAAAAYAAQQRGIQNHYEFCPDPFAMIATFEIADDHWLAKRPAMMSDLLEIDSCSVDLPGLAAYLSDHGDGPQSEFNQTLRRFVDIYRDRLKDDGSLFIQGWPQDFAIGARRIRHDRGRHSAAHIHRSWLSGFLCLGGKADDAGGSIEFTLRGYDLPELCDDCPQETRTLGPGTLMLFPSSLPHRIMPNFDDPNLTLLGLDFVPK